ncbi:MAG: DNA repair protein RadC [Bacteroidota bacterium]
MNIKKWAEEDRPREKLLSKGKSVLSDSELIGILIGSGTSSVSAVDLSKDILGNVDNSLDQLAKLSVKDLIKFKGIGEAKAVSIVAALELGRRRKSSEPQKKQKITLPLDVYNLFKPELLDLRHEEFWIVLLNRSNQVIKKHPISSGGVSGTIADPKIIFKAAIEELASSIILVHNHPSGNLKPSQADIKLTKKLKQAGMALEVPVLDHIIFCDHNFFSFADEGLMN